MNDKTFGFQKFKNFWFSKIQKLSVFKNSKTFGFQKFKNFRFSKIQKLSVLKFLFKNFSY